jgi:CheY-like chemotaxis protein
MEIVHSQESVGLSFGVTAIYVEDSTAAQQLLKQCLKGHLKELHLAEDGVSGLACYHKHRPDIILTDNEMPNMSGIEMIEEIRRHDSKVPIILITGCMDRELLLAAINAGVNHFIPKPFDPSLVLATIAKVADGLVTERLLQTAKQQELELMRYREKYHSHQQQTAFQKELAIILNDVGHRFFELGAADEPQQQWLAEVRYTPLDIMSGDSYSIRRLRNGGLFLFITDAMGKGLSASITSMISTSFINARIDQANAADTFDFRTIVGEYLNYIGKILLEEEIIAVTFLHIPPSGRSIEAAVFSMPPALLVKEGPEFESIVCNNPPVSKYLHTFGTRRYGMTGVSRVLLFSDGMNEAVTSDGELYRTCLRGDLRDTLFLKQFSSRFSAQVAKPDDDLTAIMLSRFDLSGFELQGFEIGSSLSEIEELLETFDELLTASGAVSDDTVVEFNYLAREALFNALEHGSLGVPRELKNELTNQDRYYDYLKETAAQCTRKIRTKLGLGQVEGKAFIQLSVADEGGGFNPARWEFAERPGNLPSGRGLKMIRKYCDVLFFNQTGNEITILKRTCGGQP